MVYCGAGSCIRMSATSLLTASASPRSGDTNGLILSVGRAGGGTEASAAVAGRAAQDRGEGRTPGFGGVMIGHRLLPPPAVPNVARRLVGSAEWDNELKADLRRSVIGGRRRSVICRGRIVGLGRWVVVGRRRRRIVARWRGVIVAAVIAPLPPLTLLTFAIVVRCGRPGECSRRCNGSRGESHYCDSPTEAALRSRHARSLF